MGVFLNENAAARCSRNTQQQENCSRRAIGSRHHPNKYDQAKNAVQHKHGVHDTLLAQQRERCVDAGVSHGEHEDIPTHALPQRSEEKRQAEYAEEKRRRCSQAAEKNESVPAAPYRRNDHGRDNGPVTSHQLREQPPAPSQFLSATSEHKL